MNRYLKDNFAPVADELTAFELPVTGTLPDHLDGRYLRIGPNPATDPGEAYHWFLGEGMVHGVRLEEGRARWYRNRWVRPTKGDFAPNTNVSVSCWGNYTGSWRQFSNTYTLRADGNGRVELRNYCYYGHAGTQAQVRMDGVQSNSITN